MSAINPTQNTALIVDEFIRYAIQHLTTVQGKISTTSVFPTVPAPTILPGTLFWTGYTVQPAKPSTTLREDDFPAKENVEPQNSKPVEAKESVAEGVSEEYIEEEIETRINSEEDVVIKTKFNEGKPFNVGFRGGGGFSSGFTGAINVDLGALNLSASWPELAAQFIGKNEGFTANASWDVNAYRLGFGTDKIIGADGKTRKVQPGDTTTVDAALKMLQYEVATPYKERLVGSESYKISEETFNSLNNKQKAALISYVYNVGSLRQGIASAIKEKNYALAAARIKEGPITGDGVVYPGLVRRRAEEATLFSS
jgi:GH24 family phage-related lysozyme (muramidase)